MNFDAVYKHAMQKQAATYNYGFRYGDDAEDELSPDLSQVADDDYGFRISQYLKNRYYNTGKGIARSVANIFSFGNKDLYNAYKRMAQKNLPTWFGHGGTAGGMKPVVKMGINPAQIITKQWDKRDNIQKAYAASLPAKSFQDMPNKVYDTIPAMPAGVYEMALQEALDPKYDIYRRRGMSQEHIANMISREVHAPALSQILGGRKWTNDTVLSPEEQKRWDNFNENRYTQDIWAKQKAVGSSVNSLTPENRKKLMDKFRNRYAEQKAKVPEIAAQRLGV